MSTATVDMRYQTAMPSGIRWALIITGIGWVIISVLVLDADLDSALTIGYLVAGYLVALGVMELVAIWATDRWRWLHAVLGVLFIAGGVAALTEPLRTYTLLASLLGFFLVLKGTSDVIIALVARRDIDLWWLLLVAGVLEVALGFWASGYPGRSASLLVLWVGIGAMIRGVSQLVAAFQAPAVPSGGVR